MRLGNAMYSFMLLLTHLQYQAPADYEWGICLLILQNTVVGGRVSNGLWRMQKCKMLSVAIECNLSCLMGPNDLKP
jgi:hypothetical protein